VTTKIGRGSYGNVYAVEHKEKKTRYALKWMNITSLFSDEGVQLIIIREAALMRTLKGHRNIVQLEVFFSLICKMFAQASLTPF